MDAAALAAVRTLFSPKTFLMKNDKFKIDSELNEDGPMTQDTQKHNFGLNLASGRS